jgi:predicted ester cyclase
MNRACPRHGVPGFIVGSAALAFADCSAPRRRGAGRRFQRQIWGVAKRNYVAWGVFAAMEITPRTLVERFYYEVWNRADERVAREILHPEFRFRASLGPERRGPEGFIDYMRSIHAALADYTCIIDDLVVTLDRAAARMTFKGVQRGRFFSVDPTGRKIRWEDCAFFATDGRQIVELWVLGDVDSVKQQLSTPPSSSFSPG